MGFAYTIRRMWETSRTVEADSRTGVRPQLATTISVPLLFLALSTSPALAQQKLPAGIDPGLVKRWFDPPLRLDPELRRWLDEQEKKKEAEQQVRSKKSQDKNDCQKRGRADAYHSCD